MGCDSSTVVERQAPQTHQEYHQQPMRKPEKPELVPCQIEDFEVEVAGQGKGDPANDQNADEKEKLQQACRYYSNSQYQQSIQLCQQIIQKNPQNHKALNQLGLCYYYQQKYDLSVQSLKKALQFNANEYYWNNLGKSYYYLQNYSQSIEAYLTAIEINSKAPNYYYDLGRSYYYNYQYKEGIDAYEKGLKLKPTNSQSYHHQIGLCYYYLEEYDQASEAFKKALKVDQHHHTSLNHIGLCYYYKQDYKQAEKFFNKALHLSPNNLSYLWNLGRNYYWNEDYQNAISTYQRCINISPKDGSYDAEISVCYSYMYDYDTALEWINKAIEKSPTQTYLYFRKGHIYYYLQDYNQSLLWYQKCLSIDRQNFKGTLGMANDYYYLQDYPKAVEWYLKCIELNNNNGQVYQRLAKSYYCNEQYQQSLKYFDECLKLRPEYIQPLILKGRSLFNMGRYQESVSQLRKAKKLALQIRDKSPQNYLFYIHTINSQLQAGEQFILRSKVGIITDQDKKQVQNMRKSFQNKIEKMFTFQLKDDKDKKLAKDIKKVTINKDVIEIAEQLCAKEELYSFNDMEALKKIGEVVKKMFVKDFGYFQILAYIFGVFVWINKFKKKGQIQNIQKILSKKIKYLSVMNPPTQPNLDADLQIDFPLYPQKKINLFTDKKYFQSYSSLIKEIQKINEAAQADLAPFKELLYQVQKQSGGSHAKANMKLPLREQSKDQTTFQQKLFKVLLRIFQKMFKDELQEKKQDLLNHIEEEVSKSQKMPIQQIIIVMMNKWISYIDEALKDRHEHKVATECFITDLVRGKCMFKDTIGIKEAVCMVIKICKEKSYQITQLDNRLLKETQDVVLKIKIKHCVCELQLALEFDPTLFEFGHSFYEIQRCSLGCIFGCSLFLTKDVNESFPELLFQNEKATKHSKQVDKTVHSALEFVIRQLMESVKS